MFGFNALSRTPRTRTPVRPPCTLRPAATAVDKAEDEQLRPSWFESSLDLRDGLEVTEFASLAPVASHLPVTWWLH